MVLQGAFLPGYRAVTAVDPFESFTAPIGLDLIDHVVGNMPDMGMLPTVEWYERVLQVRCSPQGFVLYCRWTEVATGAGLGFGGGYRC